jgi:5-methylcytosine-specific restriction endonuclease McrA
MPYKDIENHREQNRLYQREHYQINREKIRERHEQYRLANLGVWSVAASKWRADNPEAAKAQEILYRTSHRDKKCSIQQNRRARKLNAFVEAVDRQQVFLNDNGICQWQYCQEASPFVDPANWHLDHIVALANGGEHSYANTQVTHPTCNRRKGSV